MRPAPPSRTRSAVQRMSALRADAMRNVRVFSAYCFMVRLPERPKRSKWAPWRGPAWKMPAGRSSGSRRWPPPIPSRERPGGSHERRVAYSCRAAPDSHRIPEHLRAVLAADGVRRAYGVNPPSLAPARPTSRAAMKKSADRPPALRGRGRLIRPESRRPRSRQAQTASYLSRVIVSRLIPSMRMRRVSPSRFGEWNSPTS